MGVRGQKNCALKDLNQGREKTLRADYPAPAIAGRDSYRRYAGRRAGMTVPEYQWSPTACSCRLPPKKAKLCVAACLSACVTA